MHQVIPRIVLYVDANQTDRVSPTRFTKWFKIASNHRPVACELSATVEVEREKEKVRSLVVSRYSNISLTGGE